MNSTDPTGRGGPISAIFMPDRCLPARWRRETTSARSSCLASGGDPPTAMRMLVGEAAPAYCKGALSGAPQPGQAARPANRQGAGQAMGKRGVRPCRRQGFASHLQPSAETAPESAKYVRTRSSHGSAPGNATFRQSGKQARAEMIVRRRPVAHLPQLLSARWRRRAAVGAWRNGFGAVR